MTLECVKLRQRTKEGVGRTIYLMITMMGTTNLALGKKQSLIYRDWRWRDEILEGSLRIKKELDIDDEGDRETGNDDSQLGLTHIGAVLPDGLCCI
jgi:hypothetical protein